MPPPAPVIRTRLISSSSACSQLQQSHPGRQTARETRPLVHPFAMLVLQHQAITRVFRVCGDIASGDQEAIDFSGRSEERTAGCRGNPAGPWRPLAHCDFGAAPRAQGCPMISIVLFMALLQRVPGNVEPKRAPPWTRDARNAVRQLYQIIVNY